MHLNQDLQPLDINSCLSRRHLNYRLANPVPLQSTRSHSIAQSFNFHRSAR
jgi:hypothetical protein